MSEELDFLIEETNESMQNALVHLEREFQKIRTGKASTQMLEGIKIEYYGAVTPLEQLSNINTPDPKQIIIQPWDKNTLPLIEKAIMAANLGFNPKNDGEVLRIVVPPLTEERRKELVKKARIEAENAKVSIRNIRRNSNDAAKKLEKEGVPEDLVKKAQNDIQEMTDNFIIKTDKLLAQKEKDIMTV
ncbi:MAG TPA: ribosome recycling factor [Bacteroidales bacterium]|jgi:ribosome recycling factor|nr:ribosome recycling factor [Bacteroidales bacterium]HNZ43317.1 ribosome recycling factor [Bacteroidales bacterium]HOH84083.1 ribosome recycling factor [Bacteroidales bacterium]HPB25310.1 ribosome recycling factor [Bacteroidales bacterium]HPI29231.1 ribosome recycling factor [Bacteroidales bacterium]